MCSCLRWTHPYEWGFFRNFLWRRSLHHPFCILEASMISCSLEMSPLENQGSQSTYRIGEDRKDHDSFYQKQYNNIYHDSSQIGRTGDLNALVICAMTSNTSTKIIIITTRTGPKACGALIWRSGDLNLHKALPRYSQLSRGYNLSTRGHKQNSDVVHS